MARHTILVAGARFGKLILTGENFTKYSAKSQHKFFLATCECGKQKWISGSSLLAGDTISCG